ncbi:uncharacterized protein LOC129744323 [Uranotaenia lowii]|uniref:uncharacterized protein LOC129744323 n=1 Tax=Uranotaenia lowii TaxID=190385 RepID=UPI0024794AFA|nr:uncharacterized protein LOC129744323 [Uranotaenia lowii]XP_055592778.1 uncharacterized protein LOC129744323 [Uranotaenia lowii]
MRVEMNLDVKEIHNHVDDIDSRIAEFKQDSEKMDELNGFVDDVLNEAQRSAEDKMQDQVSEDRPKNGNKLLTGLKQHRVVTRTRGLVLRIFEAICNCTNSATIPGQRPAGPAPTVAPADTSK